MLTKAIIKETNKIGDNKYLVYIPLFQLANQTEQDAIYEATLCSDDCINNSLKVGDVVFVDFEDNRYEKPVIQGKLFTKKENKKITSQAVFKTLKVNEKVELNGDVNINGKNYSDLFRGLKNLLDSSDNISIANVVEELSKINDKIDGDVEEIKSNTLSLDTIAEGEVTNIPKTTADKYEFVVVYGFKQNIPSPNQTCFIFIPSQINQQTNFQVAAVALSGSNAWNYRIQINQDDDNNIWWFTDIEYDGNASFIATKILGVRKYES